MTIYSALPMLARAWAQPNIDYASDIPEDLLGTGAKVASGLENPWYAITVRWTWPVEFFSHFQIVRTVRSPAVRREEGHVLVQGTQDTWEHYDEHEPSSLLPVFTDPQPPPDEWVYYTFFCLNENRVWKPAGYAYAIGPRDYEWTLRLPELLPGAATVEAQGVADPAEQSSEVVEFLQSPASYLDMVTTKGETVQHFWDPKRCPPQVLPHLTASWGFGFEGITGLGRAREILAATRVRAQGSLPALGSLATGASGTYAHVFISNNLMLNTADSSFENNDIYGTGWDPIYTDPQDEGTKLDVRDIVEITLPPNVLHGYYLYIPQGRTIKCGSYSQRDAYGEYVLDDDGRPKRVFDPIRAGIPVSNWTRVRMGAYAMHDGMEFPEDPKPPVTNTIEMSLDLYDNQGLFVDNLPVLAARTLSWEWERYYNGDGRDGDDDHAVMPVGNIQMQPSDVLSNETRWAAEPDPYEGPAHVITAAVGGSNDGINIVWDTAPATGSNGRAAATVAVSGLVVGAFYLVQMTALGETDGPSWNVVALTGSSIERGPVVAPETDAPSNSDIDEWKADATEARFGIEVLEPVGGWSGENRIVSFYIERLNSDRAYGVPVVAVGDACSIDLIVTDDG
jgi:hypothetical protein